jgi:hypothetical protein
MTNRILLLWIAYALFAGFALGGSFVSGLFTPHLVTTGCVEGIPQSDCQTPEQRREAAEAALNRYTKWLMISTAILAAATIALGIATIGLYLAGERQLRHFRTLPKGSCGLTSLGRLGRKSATSTRRAQLIGSFSRTPAKLQHITSASGSVAPSLFIRLRKGLLSHRRIIRGVRAHRSGLLPLGGVL